MSLNPGVQQYGETKTGIHVTMSTTGAVKTNQPVVSITQDPMTPVEYGRVAASSKYTVTASPELRSLIKLLLLLLNR